MTKITISQEGSNPISITLSDKNIKSKENFPITRTIDFDMFKFLLTVAQACSELRKKKPIKFEKENLQITGIRCTDVGDIESMKDDIIANPINFTRDDVATFELNYIDKNKPIPNHNTCVKILNNTVINDIKQLLLKNGIRTNLIIDNGDYPIDLKSDYRGHDAYLYADLKNNSADIQKYEKEFNSFCEKIFKSFIGKKLRKKSTITKIKAYNNNFSDGMHIICDNLDDVKDNYNLICDLENKINKAITACPLTKLYDIKFVEDGYYEDLCFNCNIKPKT